MDADFFTSLIIALYFCSEQERKGQTRFFLVLRKSRKILLSEQACCSEEH